MSRPNGVSALRRIHRFIEETTNPEPLCVHEFLDRLRDMDYNIEYSENGGEDSVKVLTMHSSKGLEYPIVILDNLSEAFRGVDRDEVFVEETYGLAPRAFNADTMVKRSTVLRRLYEIKEEESSLADGLNLYYVALTRAKYGLHMLFTSPTAMPDVKYARSFAEFTDFSVWQQYVVEDFLRDMPKQERHALVFRPDEKLAGKIRDAFLWQYDFAGMENLPVKSSATGLMRSYEQGADGSTVDSIEGVERKKEKTGKDIGVAYHAFLEDFDFGLLYNEQGEFIDKNRLREVVEEACEKANEGGRYEVSLLSKEKLVEILSNPVFKKLKGKRLYKEQKFLVALPVCDTFAKVEGAHPSWGENKEETVIFQGAIDLLAIGEDGEVEIIDYKFSKGDKEYLIEHYASQLQLYRQATAKILKIAEENIRCTIVNINHGFEVNMD